MAGRCVIVAGVITTLVAGCGAEDFPPAAEPAASPALTRPPAGRTFAVGAEPEGLVVDARTGIAAAVTRDPSALTRVDLRRRRVIGSTRLPATSRHLSLAHPGGPVLVPVEQADELVEAGLSRAGTTSISVGDHPHDAVAVGDRIFVGNEFSDDITVVDRGRATARIDAPVQPGGLAATDGYLVVVAVAERVLAVYDATTLAKVAELDAGLGPTHVAAADGRAWVADTEGRAIGVYAIGAQPRPLGSVRAGGSPYGIAIDPRRQRLWVTLTDRNEAVVFDVAGAAARAAPLSDPAPTELRRRRRARRIRRDRGADGRATRADRGAAVRAPGRPPGPFRPEFWRSPLRGPWLTSILGSALLPLIVICAITGFLSHVAYYPDLGDNSVSGPGSIHFFLLPFDWPTSPAWLYALTQGLHVATGVAAIPILLAKLWSAMPKLFEWPPVRTLAHALDRASLALLVGGSLFVFFTGILNIQLFYPWDFSFVPAHYYGAFVFLAALGLHLVTKIPVALRAFRERGVVSPLRDDLAHTEPEPAVPGTTAPLSPAPPTISRRGLIATVGAGSLGLFGIAIGQVVGGPLRGLAFLAPRGSSGEGPNGFQVNKAFAASGIDQRATGSGWRLVLDGPRRREISRTQLLAMEQRTETLPIACVEGWSTTQEWTGVPLRELAALAGVEGDAELTAESLQRFGSFRAATFSTGQVDDARSLLALRVNGADLSLDHGFPARVIVPAAPGVHCTKWVATLTFAETT